MVYRPLRFPDGKGGWDTVGDPRVGDVSDELTTGRLSEVRLKDTIAADVSKRLGGETHLPLDLPTDDGIPDVAHPDVIFIPEGFGGYRYWMAYTPYPGNSRENPHVVASHDGVTWIEPPGLVNPIVTLAESQADGFDYNSDVDLVHTAEGTLRCYYRPAANVGEPEAIRFKETSDGVTWGPAVECLNVAKPYSDLLSPAVVRLPTGYRMWTVTGRDGSPRKVEMRDSADGITWGEPQVCTIPSGVDPWHLDVVHVPGHGMHMLMNTVGDPRGRLLLYWVSVDGGLTWTGSTERAVPVSGTDFDSRASHYRSTLVPVSGDPLRFDVWVNGITPAGDWRVGLMRGLDMSGLRSVEGRVDRFLIPATEMHLERASLGTANLRPPAVIFTKVSNEFARFTVVVPPTWRNIRVVPLFANRTTTPGTIGVRIRGGFMAEGSAFTSDPISAATFVDLTGQHVLVRGAPYHYTVPNGTVLAHFRLNREGGAAGDTVPGDVSLIGVMVEQAIR